MRVKGALLANHVAAIQQRIGADGWAALIATMPEDVQHQLNDKLLPATWYDESLSIELCRALLAKHGPQVTEEIGYELQKVTIKQVHQFVARLIGMERLVAMGARLWSFYHDTGEAKVDGVQNGQLRYTVTACPPVLAEGYPETIQGAIRALVTATKTRCDGIEFRREGAEKLTFIVKYTNPS